jgi:hypothetical protein
LVRPLFEVEHRFPPHWSLEDIGAAFVVKDGGGQKLAYVYYQEEPGRRSSAELLTKDEARRIAANVAMLPRLFAEAYSVGCRAGATATGNRTQQDRFQ